MKYKLLMEVGDWSRDGHNQSDVFEFYSNKPLKEVKEAYKKGCKVVGFDLINDYCCDYEDTTVDDKVTNIFKEINDPSFLDTLEWCSMVLEIAKKGDPELEVSFKDDFMTDTWKVGGYGLYF